MYQSIIILVDGILVIDGIGIILCTLVRYYITQLALEYDFVLFFVLGCVGGTWNKYRVPCGYIYSIRYTCMKAYTKRIMIKFILQMNFFVRQASSFRIRSQIVTMSRVSDFIIFQYYMYLDIILYVQDTRISDEVYRVSIISCEIIYLILFVGWVCLWAWYIFSLRMRVRMVTTDRIIRIM